MSKESKHSLVQNESVTELRFGCLSLKNPILRDKCWVKGKIALLRKPAILGRRWTHVPKNQVPPANQEQEVFFIYLFVCLFIYLYFIFGCVGSSLLCVGFL